ncbi:phage/plasmid primase, P4 family [Burkholderia cepacia]|uniref:phage/plasmid primase, P4 family n=1 Tax=Burkholderia cepacia TaxID=292 RepID=UPI00158C91FF|nr:phage/plasmid primase, P4 family [Burkholderia cepacia]MCA8164320.1 phage/plasmid primase, P4 family [Burkholderia cepacia]HEM7892212.1 toprim domain-containing protein [Burkholderia cepacia]HEM8511706.1 toprim domain-containing protein [Burkholderia cepacia]
MEYRKNNVIFSRDLYDAFFEAGIPYPKRHLVPGKIVRFSTDGTENDDAGWCRVFPDGTGAVFADYRTGLKYTWQQRDPDAPPLSAKERAEILQRQEEQRRQARAELAAQYAKASETAVNALADCVELEPAYPYVMQKGITPFGARQLDGIVVLPVYGPDGALQSLQFIDDAGEKRFLSKGKMKSGRMVLGNPIDGSPLIACEGWATGCSLHEATGYVTVVCFNGGNLATVVETLRSRYPNSRIIVAADLDESGAGKRYADKALAAASNAVAAYPAFADGREAGDFNDLHRDEGIESVVGQINAALRTERITVTEVVDPQGKPLLPSNLRCLDVRDGTRDTHSLDESGNAKRLADQVGNRLKYVPETKQWLVWCDGCWTWDNDGASVRSLAAQLPTMLYREAAAHIADADHFVRWARQSSKEKTIKSSVSLLQDFESIRLPYTQIDADDMLIGFDNGRQVLDLRSGRARPATPDDYVTKSMNVAALGESEHAVRWKQFLGEIFDGDLELIDWFQRYCGYLLTASTEEHILLFLYGRGANGKSVLVETLKHIVGDYARAVAPETLCASNRSGSAATPDLVPLIGARMVLSSEAEANSKFAQSRIKAFVAGDSMVARANYGSPITFTPMAKLIITGNHIPDYCGNDGGFDRRFKVVPFKKTFAPEERDSQLSAKLMQEAPHIFAWMVQGCLEWRRLGGLSDTPRAIREATTSYKEDQDIFGQWIAECTEQSSREMVSAEAYNNYKAWAQDNGFRPVTSRQFARGLRDRDHDIRKSNGKILISGLVLTDDRHRSRGFPPVRMQVQPVARPVAN